MAAKKKKNKRPPWRPFMWHDALYTIEYGYLDNSVYSQRYVLLLAPVGFTVMAIVLTVWCGTLGFIKVLSNPASQGFIEAYRSSLRLYVPLVAFVIAISVVLYRYSSKRHHIYQKQYRKTKAWLGPEVGLRIILNYIVHVGLFGLWFWWSFDPN